MEDCINVLQTVGFPIFCVLALGFFIYTAYKKITEDTKEREEKLYTMLANAQNTINSAVENNAKLASQIEIMEKNIEKISDDLDNIKDNLSQKEM